jgi:CheY-like chemotaxis protein
MGTTATAARHRILMVDDDQDFLEVYWEVLKRLPTQPEVHTASNGGRALALLESEPFNLMVVDLQMPKMDGLQVISVARRKYPQMRVVVLTGLREEEFRIRAYGMGVDQFWQKPSTDKEVELFLESIDSLLQQETHGGFRGIQSKSLVDILQLESLSQTSGVLKITNGLLEGRIWLQGGDIIDAEAEDLSGEAACRRILGWKAGSFEMMPPDPARERKIFISCQALLLEIAQAVDEATGAKAAHGNGDAGSVLSEITQFQDVEFALSVPCDSDRQVESWGVETPGEMADWARRCLEGFETLGDHLQVGRLQQVNGLGSSTHVAMANSPRGVLTVGFRNALGADEVRENMKRVLAKWLS